MRALPIITDPVFAKPVQYTRYERFWLKYINDERDLPFIHMLTGIHLLVIPIAAILFTSLLSGALGGCCTSPTSTSPSSITKAASD